MIYPRLFVLICGFNFLHFDSFVFSFFSQIWRNCWFIKVFLQDFGNHGQTQTACFSNSGDFFSSGIDGVATMFLIPLAQTCGFVHFFDDLPPADARIVSSKNLASVAKTSSNSPCVGQVLRIKTCPFSSTICALISPG